VLLLEVHIRISIAFQLPLSNFLHDLSFSNFRKVLLNCYCLCLGHTIEKSIYLLLGLTVEFKILVVLSGLLSRLLHREALSLGKFAHKTRSGQIGGSNRCLNAFDHIVKMEFWADGEVPVVSLFSGALKRGASVHDGLVSTLGADVSADIADIFGLV
jgi:hypothetical protein